MTQATTYYDLLNVPYDATSEQIKKAHTAAAKKYHPDVNKSPDAHRRMVELNVARDTLTDAKSRQEYDCKNGIGQTTKESPNNRARRNPGQTSRSGPSAGTQRPRWQEETRRQTDEQRRRQAEASRQRQDQRRQEEEERRPQRENEEARRQREAEEARRQRDREAKRQREAEEARRRRDREAKRQREAEEARRRRDQEAKRQREAEEARRRRDQEAKRQRDREEAGGLALKGMAALKTRDYDAAISMFSQAARLEQDPSFFEARASAYEGKGFLRSAEQDRDHAAWMKKSSFYPKHRAS